MDVVIQEAPTILRAFITTLGLFVFSAVGALALGTIVATMAVSPLPPARWFAATYIRLVRNTPLTVVFFFVVFGLPQVQISLPFFTFAVMALTLYTTTFIAEVIRSGVGAVPVGQIEAARSIGTSFSQCLRYVVLPQAARSVVPPMTSVLIALFKNTSVASAFGVFEAMGTMTSLVNAHSSAVLWIMGSIGATYILIAWAMGTTSNWIERRVVVLR